MKTGEIVGRAISLTEKHGKLLKVEGLSGHVQSFEISKFKIVYTTPSSGAELYPDVKMYMLDIWYERQKVLSEFGPTPGKIKSLSSTKVGKWVEELFAIQSDCISRTK